MVIFYRNLGLRVVQLGEVQTNDLLSKQVDLMVHELDLELCIVENKENLLMGFISFNQHPVHEHLHVPVKVKKIVILGLYGS
jgi:hypothetical protein